MSGDRTLETSLGTRGLLFDAAIALGATAISVSIFVSLLGTAPSATRDEAPIVGVLLAIHGLSLLARRLRPLLTLALVLVSGLVIVALGWPPVVLGITVVVAVYSAGAGAPRNPSLVGLTVAELSVFVSALMGSDRPDYGTQLGNAAVLGAFWFIGSTVRSRREYALDLERRNRELEQARRELADRAVAEERLRIARELHDVIAHSMSVIAVQSGAGAHVIDTNPAEAKRALQVIESTSRSTMNEFRRVLGLLRAGNGAAATDPAPSLDSLGPLIEQIRASGLDVDLQRHGPATDLAPGLQLTIYRVVQEALTNALRHADATHARVVISTDPDLVQVEVVDNGNRIPFFTEGNGLRGMRERVEVYGGRLEIGPLPEGGFRVATRLPLGDQP